MNKESIWERWSNYNSDEYAQKRIKSAQSSKLTPVSIDEENLCGVFTGSHGRYITSLENCPCGDFHRAKRPCKHMYRLAMEFRLLDVDYKSDSSQRVIPKSESASFDETIALIESFDNQLQRYLLDALYKLKYRSSNNYVCLQKTDLFYNLIDCGLIQEKLDLSCLLFNFSRNQINSMLIPLNIDFNKNMRLEKLVDWCIENIPDKITSLVPDYTTVVFTDKYKNNCPKMYKYLHRIFDSETVFNDDMSRNEIPLTQTALPDDIVTEYLIKYGHYTPNNIGHE